MPIAIKTHGPVFLWSSFVLQSCPMRNPVSRWWPCSLGFHLISVCQNTTRSSRPGSNTASKSLSWHVLPSWTASLSALCLRSILCFSCEISTHSTLYSVSHTASPVLSWELRANRSLALLPSHCTTTCLAPGASWTSVFTVLSCFCCSQAGQSTRSRRAFSVAISGRTEDSPLAYPKSPKAPQFSERMPASDRGVSRDLHHPGTVGLVGEGCSIQFGADVDREETQEREKDLAAARPFRPFLGWVPTSGLRIK